MRFVAGAQCYECFGVDAVNGDSQGIEFGEEFRGHEFWIQHQGTIGDNGELEALFVSVIDEGMEIRVKYWLATGEIDGIDEATGLEIVNDMLPFCQGEVVMVVKVGKAIFASVVAFLGDVKVDFVSHGGDPPSRMSSLSF